MSWINFVNQQEKVMSRLGITFRIDVTKIDKSKLFKGAKGTYLDVTSYIDTDKKDQYGNNGMATQSVSSDEKKEGVRGAILGNGKVFYNDGDNSAKDESPTEIPFEDMSDDIPF